MPFHAAVADKPRDAGAMRFLYLLTSMLLCVRPAAV